MPMESLRDLYVEELKDLYSAESQLVKALPEMANRASNNELRSAVEQHLEVTRGHVGRLEKIFEDLESSPRGKLCRGMAGIIEEGDEVVAENAAPDVADAAMIGAAQRVEHYEIAAYGTVRTYAERLGLAEHAHLLQQTLDEESEADERLTEVAEDLVNPKAERR